MPVCGLIGRCWVRRQGQWTCHSVTGLGDVRSRPNGRHRRIYITLVRSVIDAGRRWKRRRHCKLLRARNRLRPRQVHHRRVERPVCHRPVHVLLRRGKVSQSRTRSRQHRGNRRRRCRRNRPIFRTNRSIIQLEDHNVVSSRRRCAHVRNQLRAKRSSWSDRHRQIARRYRVSLRRLERRPGYKHGARRGRSVRSIHGVADRRKCRPLRLQRGRQRQRRHQRQQRGKSPPPPHAENTCWFTANRSGHVLFSPRKRTPPRIRANKKAALPSGAPYRFPALCRSALCPPVVQDF